MYCGFTDTTHRFLNEDQMAPFLRFAQDAVKGNKNMWFTHLYPPEEKYRDNTTTRTAEYLIQHVNGKKVPKHVKNKLGMEVLYSCDKGHFHIRGYAGMWNQDHFNHFYNLAEYYRKLSIPSAK